MRFKSGKVDIVFAVLASGIYRPWFWQHYPVGPKQAAWREQWAMALSEPWISPRVIRDGLRDWAASKGEACPPDPDAFVVFIRPVHTPASRAGLASARAALHV